MTSPDILQISPLMHVPDMVAALVWCRRIGFDVPLRDGSYAYDIRGPAAARVPESRALSGAPFPAHRGFASYVGVHDLGPVLAEVTPRLNAAGGEYVGPIDQEYEQGELLIRAPDGNAFVFGQAIPGEEGHDG